MICAHLRLSLRLRRLRRKQIEIERDINNGLFHTAFSHSRNNKYDLREKKRSSSSLHYHPVYDNRPKRKFLERAREIFPSTIHYINVTIIKDDRCFVPVVKRWRKGHFKRYDDWCVVPVAIHWR